MAYSPLEWSDRVTVSLRAAIDNVDLSLNQLALDTGIPLSTLFRRYKGQNPWDTSEIAAVAAALNTTPSALLPADEPVEA